MHAPIAKNITTANVSVLGNRRAVNETAVANLIRSIESVGLQTPITVRKDSDSLVLVTGRHRLEAVTRLGWDSIPAYFLEGDEADARLWEIAENLHRAELTELERSERIAEWVRLTAEKLSAQVEPKGPVAHRPESGINAAARELGIDRNKAQRAVKIANITPEAKAAAVEAGIGDNQSKLLKIASTPKKAQVEAVAAVVAKPKPLPPPDFDDNPFEGVPVPPPGTYHNPTPEDEEAAAELGASIPDAEPEPTNPFVQFTDTELLAELDRRIRPLGRMIKIVLIEAEPTTIVTREVVRAALKDLKLTQRNMPEAAGIPYSAFSKWLCGKQKTLNDNDNAKLCTFLNKENFAHAL